MFRKKSTWQKMADPLTHVAGKSIVKSGATAAAMAVGMTAASAAVSAVRRRQDGS